MMNPNNQVQTSKSEPPSSSFNSLTANYTRSLEFISPLLISLCTRFPAGCNDAVMRRSQIISLIDSALFLVDLEDFNDKPDSFSVDPE